MEKISYEVIQKAYTAENANFDWNEVSVTVKPMLSMDDMMLFVDTVTNSCFDTKNGTYHPEVKDFVIRSCILEMYANFELPDNIAVRYELVYMTNIIPEVMKYINQAQFNAVIMAIDSKIDERININVAKFEKERVEAFSAINELLELIRDTFSGVDADTINTLAGAIANTQVDMDRLAEKVVAENAKLLAEKESAEQSQ